MDWPIRPKPDSANASIAASPEGADTRGRLLAITRAGLPAERVAVVLLAVPVLYVVEPLWHI